MCTNLDLFVFSHESYVWKTDMHDYVSTMPFTISIQINIIIYM